MNDPNTNISQIRNFVNNSKCFYQSTLRKINLILDNYTFQCRIRQDFVPSLKLDVLRDLVPFVEREKHHRGVLLLVKLQAFSNTK